MRKRRKRDIVIELTALLDVIMIMIFMTMSQNIKLMEKNQDKLDTVQQENIEQAGTIDELTAQLGEALEKLNEGDFEELLNRLRRAESMLEGYQAVDDVVTVITVHLENKYNARNLTYGVSIDSSVTYSAKNDEEFNQAVNHLAVFVSDHKKQISDDSPDIPTVYVIFTYDPKLIYQSDYEQIDSALADIKAQVKSPNFRYYSKPIN